MVPRNFPDSNRQSTPNLKRRHIYSGWREESCYRPVLALAVLPARFVPDSQFNTGGTRLVKK